MKNLKNSFQILLFLTIVTSSCTKVNYDDDFTPADPLPLTGGYNNSDEVFAKFLIAYWNFDNSTNEMVTNTAPAQTAGATLIDGGVRGKALRLDAGYLYFANQFQKFKTDSLKSFSVSVWIKILNNGTKRTMLFQLARPTMFNGNINFALNTQSFPASNTDILRIQPMFLTVGGGTQDNLNNTSSPKIGMDKWTHIALTYDGNTGIFDIWANSLKIGDYSNRGTGNNLFKSYEPNEVIIGSNYNGIPGKAVNTDVSFAPMTGIIDELRIYNKTLSGANVKAIYNLGLEGK